MIVRCLLPAAACLALLAVPSDRAAAQATPYVASSDPAYDDLDALVSAGLVREIVVGERPHSRAAFRRFVREADRRMEAAGTLSARIEEAWERLERRFDPEEDDDEAPFALAPTPTRLDGALSDSPDRPLRSGKESSEIDGTLNPLLQRNGGRELANGATLAVESGVALRGMVAGEVRPRAYLAVPRGSGGAEVELDVVDAYARALLGPVAVEAGRFRVTWGHGSEGGAMLSDNARGVDRVRLTTDRPNRLPGFLAGLGHWWGSVSVGRLGDDRDHPGAKVIQVRQGWRPGRYVELGFNYLNLQGGEGAPDASFGDRLRDVLFLTRVSPEGNEELAISDKVVGVDLRVLLPPIRSSVYANFLTTDDRGYFQQPGRGYWQDAVWLVGAEAADLGPEGRLSASVEWRHAGAIPHTHHRFTSGLTLDGRLLGDPLGPNAAGLSAEVGWTAPSYRLRLRGAWERYSGDLWNLSTFARPDGYVTSTPWRRVADNPDEVRRRVVVEYLRFAGSGRLETSVRLGYERVSRFGFDGGDRSNLLLQGTLRASW